MSDRPSQSPAAAASRPRADAPAPQTPPASEAASSPPAAPAAHGERHPLCPASAMYRTNSSFIPYYLRFRPLLFDAVILSGAKDPCISLLESLLLRIIGSASSATTFSPGAPYLDFEMLAFAPSTHRFP